MPYGVPQAAERPLHLTEGMRFYIRLIDDICWTPNDCLSVLLLWKLLHYWLQKSLIPARSNADDCLGRDGDDLIHRIPLRQLAGRPILKRLQDQVL